MFRPTWDTHRLLSVFVYGTFTLCGATFLKTSTNLQHAISGSRNPDEQAHRFRLLRFRSPLLTESRLIYTPPGTEMFHFPGCRFLYLCIQYRISSYDGGWVAPFGNLRFNACVPLPVAYRSLPRPSSPVGAKASIMCPQ